MKIKIALLQLLPGDTLDEQLQNGIRACEEAKNLGADIALFPEMWSDGYRIPQDAEQLEKLVIKKDSDFVKSFGNLAEKLQMAIGITILEKHEPRPLNSILLFDRTGQEKLHYSKVHTCDFDEEKMLSSGDDFYVVDLDLGKCSVKVGSMICFDREFPESARILMLKGAELILAPNACPMEINRLSALRTRAYENMVAIATCNYPKGQPDCNGHSTVFDGVAWLRGEPGVRNMCIYEAPEEAGVYVAELDLTMLRDYRAHEVMGDKYRHPEKYGTLVDDAMKNEQSEIRIDLEDTEWPFEYTDHDRRIARAIVFDDDGYYYFVRAERDDDFGKATLIETSGGGVEEGEDLVTAIKRELKEELGVDVEVICKLGTVSDYYNLIHRHNLNNYFLCKVVSFGDKNLTQDEIESFHLSTLRLSCDEAVAEYDRCRETGLGRLIANRELPILRRASEIINQGE